MADGFKPCLVENCNDSSSPLVRGCRGFCNKHYNRFLRYGDPTAGGTPVGEPQEFFKSAVREYDGEDCLLWPYARDHFGYGKLRWNGVMSVVSRLICIEEHGEPPTPDHEAAHNCGNGKSGCVAKRHIVWKTKKENQKDRLLHGTDNRGSRHYKAKLTEDQAREIIRLKGVVPQRELAIRFGVATVTISSIQIGKTWAWVI